MQVLDESGEEVYENIWCIYASQTSKINPDCGTKSRASTQMKAASSLLKVPFSAQPCVRRQIEDSGLTCIRKKEKKLGYLFKGETLSSTRRILQRASPYDGVRDPRGCNRRFILFSQS
ncbi:hypothetical protein Tsubulata_044620 [Turnera subulata]|uniref:Uncharacterized protein n=1 Tax=Turnera subulata TaxID=218843 RepID=A0A9Q0JA08_9ROSI|nr:hypothetical protein Tsubulata_044620 [Turnera subulata]